MKKNLLIIGLTVSIAILAFYPRKGITDPKQPAIAPENQVQSVQRSSVPTVPVEQPTDANHIKIRVAKITVN